MFLKNLGAMRKAALERKAKRWGFDFEAETPITNLKTVVDQAVECSRSRLRPQLLSQLPSTGTI